MPHLTNQQIAIQFSNIGSLLDVKGENRFKILAYYKAADGISHLDQSLYELWTSGADLTTLPGIGRAIDFSGTRSIKTYGHRIIEPPDC